jgi:hypothetical protein
VFAAQSHTSLTYIEDLLHCEGRQQIHFLIAYAHINAILDSILNSKFSVAYLKTFAPKTFLYPFHITTLVEKRDASNNIEEKPSQHVVITNYT